MNKNKFSIGLSMLGLLALISSMFFVSSVSAVNTYQVENWKVSEDGTTWYYNITYTKSGASPPDISHLELDFLCFDKPDNRLSVYISSAGGDCLQAIVDDEGLAVFPTNTTLIKWEFDSTCIQNSYGSDREITVWFSTFPYVYDPGAVLYVEAKGGGGPNEVKDTDYPNLEAPFCGHFFEVPELPLGTITAVATPLLAYGLLWVRKRES